MCKKSMEKTRNIFEKLDDFENRPPCKGYSLCKLVSLGKKLKSPKTCARRVYNNTRVVLCKKFMEKTRNIFEKLDDFENRPSCKGYRLCKLVSLDQKLKWPKTCAKRLYYKTKVVLCKKPLERKTKYSRNETILKIGHLAKTIAHAKAVAIAKYSVSVKD